MSFKNYIKEFKADTKLTHVSFPAAGYTGGKYHVPDTKLEEFYKKYFESICKKESVYLVERVTDVNFSFFLDIDSKEKDIDIKSLLTVTKKIISENVNEKYVDDINENVFISKRNEKYHINFPKFIVNDNVAQFIAKNIINSTEISKELRNAIDTSVYRTGLRLIGSKKAEADCEKEIMLHGNRSLVYQIYDLENDTYTEFTNTDYNTFENYIIRQKSTVNITPLTTVTTNVTTTIPKKVKTIKNVTSTSEVDPEICNEIKCMLNEITIGNFVDLDCITKITSKQNSFGTFCYYISFENDSKRICPFEEREHSRKTNPIYLELTINGVSIRCYDSDCINKKYPNSPIELPKKIEIKYPNLYINMASKYENSNNSKIIITSEIRKALEESLSQSHYKIAKVAYMIFKNKFRIDDIKNPDWYEFNGNNWKKSHLMNILMSEELHKYYRAIKTVANKDSDTETNESGDVMRNSMIESIIVKLENVSFKKNILTEMYHLFKHCEPNFLSKLDCNPYLIGFEDGVYDLATNEFRKGKSEDYITFSTGYDYIPYDSNCKEVSDINSFLSKIIPNKKVMEYLLKVLGRSLLGIADEQFYIWTGLSGANGKSTLINFLEYTLGDYTTGVDVGLLTNKRALSSSASPDIIRLKGKRIVSFAEPEYGDTLKTGILKAFSGGDSIIARELYKAPISFKLQASMIMCCNDLPALSSIDGGTLRRIRIIDFTSRFCDNPKKKNEFMIDPNIKTNIQIWRPYFMSMLIHYYSVYNDEIKKNGRIEEPEQVKIATNKYKADNDKFNDFFEECIEEGDSICTIKIIYNNFVDWWTSNTLNKKIPDIKELIRAMKIKYGEEDFNKYKGFNVIVRTFESNISDDF
jgi:P4 family phage/plasmid primase-like protien